MKLALERLVTGPSVTPVCPRCKRAIPSEDVNVANDIAFCRNCDVTHSLSALATGTVVEEDVDLSRPPAGTWFERGPDGFVLGATHRAFGQAAGLLFFALFWNGIVSFFVCLALVSTWQHLGLPFPAWVPPKFARSAKVPLGVSLFLWVFLTPFILVGLAVACSCLSCLAGRTEARLQAGQGLLFTGVGPLGFRKRFQASEVRDVRIENRAWRDNNGNSRRSAQIILDTESKPIKFGSTLSQERRAFMAAALKQELVRR